MLNVVTVIFILLFMSSCAVVPVTRPHSVRDSACGLSTHEWNLDLVKMGGYSANCDSPECVVSVGLVAVATIGITAIVSGSIVIVGNAVHWIEQQGSCDADKLEQGVEEINTPLIQHGGKPIKTKQALEKELEDL